jgi:hypothetical protein
MMYISFHQVILLADYHPLHTAEDNPVLCILKSSEISIPTRDQLLSHSDSAIIRIWA